MANYLCQNRKKLDRLERLEADLYRSMDRGDPEDKLERIAEKIRSAWISVLRAAVAGFTKDGGRDEAYDRNQKAIQWWRDRDVQWILYDYSHETDGVVHSKRREPGQPKRKEVGRFLYGTTRPEPSDVIQGISFPRQSQDGKQWDLVDFLPEVDAFFDVEVWFVSHLEVVGPSAVEIESRVGEGLLMTDSEFRDLYADVVQTRQGRFAAESTSDVVVWIAIIHSDFWEVRSRDAAFLAHMEDRFGETL